MSKNPFQILDFLGYFFPGATVMIALLYCLPELQNQVTTSTNTSAIIYIVCIIIAYIIGHVVSLLSSITVEKYAIWKYGYPSDYLLNDYQPNQFFSRGSKFGNKSITQRRSKFLGITKCVLKVIIWVALFPVSLTDIILSKLFGINYYYTRKLSGQQITMIKGKCQILFRNIGITENTKDLFAGDNHRIVHNYYYENAGKHSSRMENCIAIYDFLRAMTLVICVIFMILFYRSILTIDVHLPVDWERVGLLVLIGVLAYVFYMGFLKFYRKFTVENFMCLICDKNLDFPKMKDTIILAGSGTQQYMDNQDITYKDS